MQEKPVLSTQNPSALLPLEELAWLSQSLAVLDAALMPEWEGRYYSFTARWKEAERMASMRNGSGDDYFLWLSPAGAVLKGFAHESAVWKQLRGKSDLVLSSLAQQLPPKLEPFLHEPAFSLEETTFCLWRQPLDPTWIMWQPPVPQEIRFFDGSADLLALLDGNPVTYQAWAEDYYEIRPDLAALQAVYAHMPLTEELLRGLGSPRRRDEVAVELEEIGYPSV
ncbi:hypothetical protein ccbrp13_60170 [Ktedonobacteria bacterium brp13]|nr:hypothetical protein ccbrp13_60170 [Ktedonobacteria bacterium brp13]